MNHRPAAAPRRARPRASLGAAAAFALACAALACRRAPTEVEILIQTNAPSADPLFVTIVARVGVVPPFEATGAPLPPITLPGGRLPDGTVQRGSPGFVGGFVVRPQSNEPRFTARIEGRSGSVTVRTFVSSQFLEGRRGTLSVDLDFRCAAPDTGCTGAGACTRQRRCEERGLTCGRDAQCLDLEQAPVLVERDAGADAALDARAVDATADAGFDAPAGPDARPDADACGGCPAGQSCCAGACVRLESDPDNCGACGAPCSSRRCEARACLPPCGGVGQACCAGASCAAGAYCYAPEDRCYANPTLLEEPMPGPACADLGVAHTSPGWLIRFQVTGRPGAAFTRYVRKARCVASAPEEALFCTRETGVIPAGGTFVSVPFESGAVPDCYFSTIGEFEAVVRVDGQVSAPSRITVYNSSPACATAPTGACASAATYCHPPGAGVWCDSARVAIP